MSIAEFPRAPQSAGDSGPHPAAGPRRRAVRARRHAAVQGRHRRRGRGRSAATTSTGPPTSWSTRRSSTSTAAASRPTRSPSPPSCQARRDRPGRRRAVPPHPRCSRCRRPPTPATTPRIVRETAILRRLIEAGTKIVQLGYAGDGDVDDIVDAAQAEVYGVTDRRTSEDYLPLSAIMEGALDEIEAIGSRGGEMVGRADRVRRLRRADQRAAPRPDDRRGRPSGGGQGARARHAAAHADRLDHDGRGGRRRPARRAGRRAAPTIRVRLRSAEATIVPPQHMLTGRALRRRLDAARRRRAGTSGAPTTPTWLHPTTHPHTRRRCDRGPRCAVDGTAAARPSSSRSSTYRAAACRQRHSGSTSRAGGAGP